MDRRVVVFTIFACACAESSELDPARPPDVFAPEAPPPREDPDPEISPEDPFPDDPQDPIDPQDPMDPLPNPITCTAPPLAPGDHLITIEHGGLSRDFELHVPAAYDGATAIPLVLYFHPLGATRRYLTRAGTVELSDRENFLAAFPAGRRGSWNGGACCGPANGVGLGDPIDDVGFARTIVAHIQSIACVDTTRIYASGFSNGGFLSHRLACEASDLFAAIAPVSSVNGLAGGACTPARPVPVLSINGTEDALVPYAGGFGFPGVTDGQFVSVAASFANWAAANSCTGAPSVTFEQRVARCETYSSCAGGAEVTQCTITGGGHCWFGEAVCAWGANPPDLNATETTWAFLSRFSLR